MFYVEIHRSKQVGFDPASVVKGTVHPKMKILLSFTHPCVI